MARMSVLLFTGCTIIKSYIGSLIKLSRRNLFRLHFIEKNIIRGVKEGNLREVIGIYLIVSAPTTPIFELIHCFDETYVKHF